jgi:thiosulfate dehydrogenase
MIHTKTHAARIVTVLGVTGVVAATSVAMARAPFTEEELEQQMDALYVAAQQGYDLWHGSKSSMTTNGLACANCHPDTAASNPQTFPKYMTMYGKVIPWQEMVNWCIENPQLGERLDPNGEEMTAIKAYAMYLHRGKPIEPGLASRQTTPVVVEFGTGFKREPTGLGVDTREYRPDADY